MRERWGFRGEESEGVRAQGVLSPNSEKGELGKETVGRGEEGTNERRGDQGL